MKIQTLVLAALMALPTMAQAQEKKNTNVPDWLTALASRIEIHGYGQAGYTWQHGKDGNTNTADVKRVVVWATARITDRWSFLYMHDFTKKSLEWYTDYRISKGKELTVRFGQFKTPYSLENPISPTKIEVIDCNAQGVLFLAGVAGEPLYGTHTGRDIGLMAYGDLFNDFLHYEAAVMNGQGINCKDGNNQKDVVLKLEVKATDELRVVASGQLGKGHAVAESMYNPAIAEGDNYTRNRWSAGAEWKSGAKDADYWKTRPTAVHAEVLGGRDGDVNSWGAYVSGSVPVCKALDVVGSVDYFNYNTDLEMQQTNVMVGVQHWFYRGCRVQLQYMHSNPCHMGKASYGRLMTQVQVSF